MRIFDPTLRTLERALEVRLERHQLLAGNLANADTPGFTPRDLDVAAALASGPGAIAAAPGPAPGHVALEGHLALAASPPPGAAAMPALAAPAASPNLDGNAVDVDRTMVALAENALQYGAAARAAGKKLAILRYVASDGAA